MRICSLKVPTSKDEWNQMVWSAKNIWMRNRWLDGTWPAACTTLLKAEEAVTEVFAGGRLNKQRAVTQPPATLHTLNGTESLGIGKPVGLQSRHSRQGDSWVRHPPSPSTTRSTFTSSTALRQCEQLPGRSLLIKYKYGIP